MNSALADIPSGWRWVPVRHLSQNLDYLRVPKNSAERAEMIGNVPYWGANSVQGYVDRALVEGPIVLVGEDGAPFFDPLASVAFAIDEPIWPNNHVHVLRPLSGVDFRFLAASLNAVDYSLYVKGSTRDKLNQSELSAIVLAVPSLEEQEEIAAFLDRETAEIDAFIADQEELIGLLAERRRSTQVAVMSRAEVAPRVRLRFLFSQSREDDSVESEVLSVYRDHGVIPKSSRADNFNKTPEDVSRYLVVRPGYLVVNKMKAWQGSLGVSDYDGIVSPDYDVLRPTSRTLSPDFAHAYLRSPRMIGEYAVRSVGIRPAQWRLYWDQLRDIEIPVPSLDRQREIVRMLNDETAELDAAVADAREAIALSRERRAALISAAVTGEIDVRGAV
ncbi:restriction endonuclease subunit S [soil metagenome]